MVKQSQKLTAHSRAGLVCTSLPFASPPPLRKVSLERRAVLMERMKGRWAAKGVQADPTVPVSRLHRYLRALAVGGRIVRVGEGAAVYTGTSGVSGVTDHHGRRGIVRMK